MPTLNCMNCHKSVLAGQGKIFASVFCCQTCHDIASSFFDKLLLELQHLTVVAKESIRVALVQGKFHLSEAGVRDISKKELLETIVQMESARGKGNVG